MNVILKSIKLVVNGTTQILGRSQGPKKLGINCDDSSWFDLKVKTTGT